ncbi:hypothetical protein [Methylobacter sp. BlB1]|uniref:hypothetical protein n=1 Tax=Methylobacter sp. BlB1 TaxID=2785914 RepID=UPI001894C4EA|nr:hypothetical protein [Methylobacter sp. BlB1]MBF6649770.1 hypothetical protein [Methylobacter sp. BlB1]
MAPYPRSDKRPLVTVLGLSLLFLAGPSAMAWEQRNEVSFLRGPYNIEFFDRHNRSFRYSAAIHFAHAKQHDILQLTPLSHHEETDRESDAEFVHMLFNPPRTEPTMAYYGPYIARVAWQLYRAIDWTHMHHEQTYDILSDQSIPWQDKKQWTDRSVHYYLTQLDIPRSPAPLDVTMRRAGVMMKPYFTYFRNYYPQSNNFFYVAHWWHPAIYEAMMTGGNDREQETMVEQTNATMEREILKDRPQRMLLSREVMPRYSRLSPESANIFDNLHMLHGIAYDILAYEGWNLEQKQKELYRVIKAMSYQPGDEKLVRKFSLPHPDLDIRVYYDWMKGTEGDMNRIMKEMLEEMMPAMMPEGVKPGMKQQMMAQFRLKLTPGMQPGEKQGSLMDALKAIMPAMKMMPEAMEPGATPTKMIETMLRSWQKKYADMPDMEPMAMALEPSIPQALKKP